MDASGAHAGTIIMRKPFGTGQVKGIDGSRIVVSCKGKDTEEYEKIPFLFIDEEYHVQVGNNDYYRSALLS